MKPTSDQGGGRSLPRSPDRQEADPNDEDLIAAMADSDQDAADRFVRRHERRVYLIAYSMTGDRGIAEDVAQETFLRVWRYAEVFDPARGSALSWTSTIAKNLAIDAGRKRTPVPVDPVEALILLGKGAEPSMDDVVVGNEMARRLWDVLLAMPETQRRALLLSSFYGQSASQIAADEGIPLGTAKSRIRLALARVRAALAEEDEEGPA